MPTTEERLAALEKQMAAWMDQRPTTYYTHQYSGEEIDAAVGRALTGGALDTSVTNVSNQLGTFVRPNLLDNWYFGRPVDQRGGYVVPGGTQIYADSALTDTSPGVTTAWRKVEYVNSTYCIYRGTGGTGLYYVKTADVVRGYTGGYSIDRWRLLNNNVLVIANNAIELTFVDNNYIIWEQFESIPKGIYSLSLLFADGAFVTWSGVVDVSQAGFEAGTARYKNWNIAIYHDKTVRITCIGSSGDKITILAAKLELGPTQTLAHQDAAGNWVLNEVPEYGEQLRRCQRYCFVTNANHFFSGWCTQTNKFWTCIPTPVPLRAKPIISVIAPGTLISGTPGANYSTSAGQYEIENADSAGIKMAVNIDTTALTMGAGVLCDGKYVFSADL